MKQTAESNLSGCHPKVVISKRLKHNTLLFYHIHPQQENVSFDCFGEICPNERQVKAPLYSLAYISFHWCRPAGSSERFTVTYITLPFHEYFYGTISTLALEVAELFNLILFNSRGIDAVFSLDPLYFASNVKELELD